MKVKSVFILFFSILLFLTGCAPTVVNLPVYKPAEIDIKGIKKIAILDFSGPENSGTLASSMLTSELLNSKFFQIFERSKVDQILKEHELAMTGVIDESTARQVGQLLGVDGLIFGDIVTYRVEPDEVGREKVQKKVGTGKYRVVTKNNKKVREEITKTVLVDQEYKIRRGTAAVTFRMVNVETGELLASNAKSESFNSGKIVNGRGDLKARDAILNDLMSEMVKEFAHQIAPHLVQEKHQLEDGKGMVKVGVQYAKNGLWDEALDAFKAAVKQTPQDPKAHYNLGLAFQVVGDFDSAEKEFQKAIALKNKNLYFQALAHIKELRLEREKLRQQVGGSL